MGWLYQLRVRLHEMGLLPASKLALTTWYLLGFDIFLFVLQEIFTAFRLSWGQNFRRLGHFAESGCDCSVGDSSRAPDPG